MTLPAAPVTAPAPDSPRGQDLIARARQIRRDAGVGFAAMARRLQICKSTLSKWETNPPPRIGCAPRTWGTPEFWVAILDVLDRDQASGG